MGNDTKSEIECVVEGETDDEVLKVCKTTEKNASGERVVRLMKCKGSKKDLSAPMICEKITTQGSSEEDAVNRMGPLKKMIKSQF